MEFGDKKDDKILFVSGCFSSDMQKHGRESRDLKWGNSRTPPMIKVRVSLIFLFILVIFEFGLKQIPSNKYKNMIIAFDFLAKI